MTQGPDDLLVRFRAGDPAAFDQLVQDMGPRLKGFFLRQGAQEATAEDLSQHVYLRAFQSRERYQPTGRLDAYLLRIARNLWIDNRRRKRPVRFGDEPPECPDPSPGPLDQVVGTDRAELLREGMERLDEDTRELLELAVLQQLPYKDVGELLGIPVGTVKSRVYYSLRKLRDLLTPLRDEAELES